jgi:hypothetical protein
VSNEPLSLLEKMGILLWRDDSQSYQHGKFLPISVQQPKEEERASQGIAKMEYLNSFCGEGLNQIFSLNQIECVF